MSKILSVLLVYLIARPALILIHVITALIPLELTVTINVPHARFSIVTVVEKIIWNAKNANLLLEYLKIKNLVLGA
jgi:hypothetical protein